MKTVLDIECTMFGPEKSPAPYYPENYLVSVGHSDADCRTVGDNYFCFKHNEEPPFPDGKNALQYTLDETTLLIGHNIKFDLSWLLECGFEYTGAVYDTMIHEYVKRGGLKQVRLNLDDSCKRYGIEGKSGGPAEYMAKGIGFEAMPWEVVEEYGRNDVEITRRLYHAQND